MKEKLVKNQVMPGREIYSIEPKNIKKIVEECYCKNVSKNDHDNLFKELSSLLGLYSYLKNETKLKPYVIIGSEL